MTGGGEADPLRELRDALRSPVEDTDAFSFLLSSTLSSLGLNSISLVAALPSGDHIKSTRRYLSSIQVTLLTTIVPTFLPALDENDRQLLRTFFVPQKQTSGLALRRNIALTSYQTLSSLLSTKTITPLPRQSREYVLEILEQLVQYGVGDMYWAIWSAGKEEGSKEAGARDLNWEEAVGCLVGLPAKVGNAVGRWKTEGCSGDMPEVLVSRPYFDQLVTDLEGLMYELSQSSSGWLCSGHLRPLIQRLHSLGLFQSSTNDRSPTFWTPVLPSLLAHLHPRPDSSLPAYPTNFLPTLLLSLSSSTFVALMDTLLQHITLHVKALDPSIPSETARRVGEILEMLIGPAVAGGEALEAISRCILNVKGRMIDLQAQAIVRAAVCWVSLSSDQVIKSFLETVLDVWTDTKHIRYAMYSQQFCLTYTVLLTVSLLPPHQSTLVNLSRRPRFLTAIQSYLSHPDPSIRRLGLLVAEVVSERTIEEPDHDMEYSEKDEMEELKASLESEDGPRPKVPRGSKRLKFGSGMWEGQGEGREETRWLRSSVGVKDVQANLLDEPSAWLLGWREYIACSSIPPPASTPAPRLRAPKSSAAKSPKRPKIVMLDDEQLEDTMEGYDSPSPSSRSPSPDQAYLDEVAADPSLALDTQQKKKIQRPVYISQLLGLIKDREKPDCLEMALKFGESLIRAKRNFGGELEENAENLAMMTVALNDPFNLEDFDEKRQRILNALVACAPRTVAPYLAEIYFAGQFSLQQRAVILTALSMGSRELAGMSVPLAATNRKIDFPSKTLPPALHRKYITDSDMPDQIEAAVDGIRGLLLSKGAKKGEETVPELAREKRLKVASKRTLVAETGSLASRQMDSTSAAEMRQQPVIPYKDVAAEYFVLPLINRFWAFYQDSMTREERGKIRGDRYRGAGTGMILSPMALEKLLMTLVLMLHAARHSPVYLAVLAPESLELAVTVASRQSSRSITTGEEGSEEKEQGESGVVGAALELALVVLDASYDLDAGRTLATTKPALVSALGEWASGLFKVEERGGERLAGQGGLREGRIRSGAAGVVVKVSEIAEKWGRFGMM